MKAKIISTITIDSITSIKIDDLSQYLQVLASASIYKKTFYFLAIFI